MKSGLLAAALVFATLSAPGCIFNPRDAEPPDTEEQDPWIVPNTAKDVFLNLTSGFASNKNSNFERSLDPVFHFYPRPEDETNLGSAVFADWTKDVELSWLTRVKEVYAGERTVQFGDDEGRFAYEDIQVGTATFEGQYLITLDPGDGSDVETYAGIARFIVVQGTLGWVLTEWRDLDVNGNFATSGYLRGTLRPL
ncbi:MAG: hypothetical protein C4574_03130 [Candidatus Latescibacterota bacterium]|jgi:hypothetical protein|nr:MAG: hypothetical protein C4574_03130 [Candidatus Latescibacterota bacterium]